MRVRFAAFFLVVVTGVACTASGGIKPDTDVLAEARMTWMDAMKAGDAAKAASVFAEDAVSMPPGFPTNNGCKAIEQFYRDGLAQASVKEVMMNHNQTRVDGGSAMDRGTFRITWAPKDREPFTLKGRYLLIGHKKANGEWELVWEMHAQESKVPVEQL